MSHLEERLLPRSWWGQLISLRGRIFVVYFYLYTFNFYHLVGRDYRDKYETLNCSGNRAARRAASNPNKTLTPRSQPQRSEHEAARSWFQPMPKIYVFVRYLTTVYMIYSLIKSLMPNQVSYLVDSLNLGKPAHCFILGRFKIHHRINQQVAPIFSSFHLIWRVIMFFYSDHRRIANNAIFFLMLDEHDVGSYYKFLANKRFIEAKKRRKNRVGPTGSLFIPSTQSNGSNAPVADDKVSLSKSALAAPQLVQDVMSYNLIRDGVTTLRLRPNRTPDARRDFIRFQARVTFWAVVIFIPIATGVAITLVLHVFTHKRYLQDYSDCDPLLERLARENRLGDWLSYSPFRHQLIALAFDVLENLILWLESGLVSVCFVSYALAFNHDNLTYWDHIRQRIATLLNRARNVGMRSMHLSKMTSPADDDSDDWTLSIQELHIEVADFMRQWRQSNKIMTDLVSMALTVWFILFATFNYGLISHKQRGFPLELSLVLLFVFAVMSSCWFILLFLHQRSMRSYSSLCSLMALDRSKHKRQFTRILDYFVRQKAAYTVYRSYPITAATFLTLIGYSFSCFFILASSRNR